MDIEGTRVDHHHNVLVLKDTQTVSRLPNRVTECCQGRVFVCL